MTDSSRQRALWHCPGHGYCGLEMPLSLCGPANRYSRCQPSQKGHVKVGSLALCCVHPLKLEEENSPLHAGPGRTRRHRLLTSLQYLCPQQLRPEIYLGCWSGMSTGQLPLDAHPPSGMLKAWSCCVEGFVFLPRSQPEGQCPLSVWPPADDTHV